MEAGIPKDSPRVYRIGFFCFFGDSSTFGRYSLWNYWVYWDSYRFGILFDRKHLFYIFPMSVEEKVFAAQLRLNFLN